MPVSSTADSRTAAGGDRGSVKEGIGIVAALAALVCLLSATITVIRGQGWVTDVDDWIQLFVSVLVAFVGVIASEAFGSKLLNRISSPWTRRLVELGALVVFSGLIVFAYVNRDTDRITLVREISQEAPEVVYELNSIGSPGDRYQVAVRPRGSLKVSLRVRRGQSEYISEMDSDGVVRFDRTLAGGDWSIVIESVNNETGKFEVDIEASDAREIHFPEARVGSLGDAQASDGYLLEVKSQRPVHIAVESLTDGFNPSLEVSTIRNLVSAYTEQTDHGWEVFEPFDPGEYVITIQAPDRSIGRYRLIVDKGAGGPSPTDKFTTPPKGKANVPNVYDLDVVAAQQQLSDAGFAAVTFDVCSGSVQQGHVRQVYMDSDGETPLVDAPGRPVFEGEVESSETLYVKVSNGRPCG